MEYRGYSEQDLVSNRAAVFLYGGTDAERRDWARESAGNFASEGPMMEVTDGQALQSALAQNRGLVFVPDLLALAADAQLQILQSLRGIEERPKLVLGLPMSPEQALQQGQLREDLSYRLQLARVDMDTAGLREVIRARRQAREEALASVKTLVQPPAAKKKGSGVNKSSSRTRSTKARS